MQDYTCIQGIQERIKELNERSQKTTESFSMGAKESVRVADFAHNSAKTINDLEAEFESQTELSKGDMKTLFLATAAQCVRQYILTDFPDRLNDKEAAELTPGHTQEHSDRSHRYYNPSLNEIITNPVPFDAMYGSPDFNLGLSGRTHRRRTLGHDPALGWIFGTANIATSTVTTSDLKSYHVKTGTEIKMDRITNNAHTPLIFHYTKEKLLNNGLEGKIILGTSLIKEFVHLRSDIKTRESLPFPVVFAFSPELAKNLASHGIDMANTINVGKQASYSILINTLIAMIRYLFYDADKEKSRRLYDARTRNILSYSNLIASASNVLYIAISASLGNMASSKKLDIGGFIVTLHRLISDTKFIQEVKEEFVFSNFKSKLNRIA